MTCDGSPGKPGHYGVLRPHGLDVLDCPGCERCRPCRHGKDPVHDGCGVLAPPNHNCPRCGGTGVEPKMVPADPPPRYDEVYEKGAKWLDDLAEGREP